jgi:hypothetical protein
METETWIERMIVQELSHPDERYKHDYKSKEASTVELVIDCAYLKQITEDRDVQTWEDINELEEEIEGRVEERVERLREQELLTKVGEQPLYETSLLTRLAEGAKPEAEPPGTSPVWTLTDEGLAEAARINAAYEEELAELTGKYEHPEDAPRDELFPLLKKYGVKPDAL